MARHKKGKTLSPWLYEDNPESGFSMPTDDLFRSKRFQQLPAGAQILYLQLISWKQRREQRQGLYQALLEYYADQNKKTTENDLQREANDPTNNRFTFPEKRMEEYGDVRTIRRNLKVLIEKGYVAVFWAKFRRPTIYRFTYEWKQAKIKNDHDNLT